MLLTEQIERRFPAQSVGNKTSYHHGEHCARWSACRLTILTH